MKDDFLPSHSLDTTLADTFCPCPTPCLPAGRTSSSRKEKSEGSSLSSVKKAALKPTSVARTVA